MTTRRDPIAIVTPALGPVPAVYVPLRRRAPRRLVRRNRPMST
jgi:hypothetical protein